MEDAAPREKVPLLVMERLPPDMVSPPAPNANVEPALVNVPDVIVMPAIVSARAPALKVPPAMVTFEVSLIWW